MHAPCAQQYRTSSSGVYPTEHNVHWATMTDLDEDSRALCMEVALKCADLGHLASPPQVFCWGAGICNFGGGDKLAWGLE